MRAWYFGILLSVSLFFGMVVAVVTTMAHPPITSFVHPLNCDGEIVYEQRGYSPRPGAWRGSTNIFCIPRDNPTGRVNITGQVIAVSGLAFSLAVFALLLAITWPLARPFLGSDRRDDPFAPRAPRPMPMADLLAHLIRRGALRGGGGGAAERLARLNDLRSRGLISDEDYEAKKAEILHGL